MRHPHLTPEPAAPRGDDQARGLLRKAGSALGRRLPRALHPLVQDMRFRLGIPAAGRLPDDAASTDTVTVLGYLSAPTGLGEGARLCAATLAGMGFRVGLLDATPLHGVPHGVPLPEAGAAMAPGDAGGPLICHLNPPDFELTLHLLRLSGARRKLVAYWAWELPTVPSAWRRAFRLVHEVWVPSRFVADALRRSGFRRPIRVVAHPVPIPAAGADAGERQHPGTLTVLTTFAYESGFERKNPLAAIDAFRAAFGARQDVRLIIKVRGASLSGQPERRLRERVATSANIHIHDAMLSNREMTALIERADILLSLHRAEGFGLPLAEAMLMGKPVVATGWSGNLEFMDETSACLVGSVEIAARDESSAYAGVSARWADPSIEAAAGWLRALEDPQLRRAIGARACAHAAERLSVPAFARAVAPAFAGAAAELCAAASREPVPNGPTVAF